MAFTYKYLPDVALADIAFEVDADSWQDLLRGAMMATTSVMVDPATVEPAHTQEIAVEAETLESLLFDWLCEIVYLKDSEQLFVVQVEFRKQEGGPWRIAAMLTGERIDRSRHRLGQDVKAVTYHLFEVVNKEDRFHARVVLDI